MDRDKIIKIIIDQEIEDIDLGDLIDNYSHILERGLRGYQDYTDEELKEIYFNTFNNNFEE